MYIGIDFGTSNSTLSIYMKGGARYTGILPALCGNSGIPTLIRYDADMREFLIGADCDIEHFVDDTIRNIKAKIRKGGDVNERVTTGGNRYSYGTLITEYLQAFIKQCIQTAIDRGDINSNEKVEGITVTVPCGFAGRGMTRSEYGRVIQEGVIAAYRRAIEDGVALSADYGESMPIPCIIEEPVAAAVEYLQGEDGYDALSNKSEMKILVADLGGGTFDVTVVKCNGRDNFRILEKNGDLSLGGNNWDEALLDYAMKKYQKGNPNSYFSTEMRPANLIRATKVKEGLTRSPWQTFFFKDERMIKVSREEFEATTRELLKRLQSIIQKSVEKCGGINSIDKIILVGGACQMPQIKNGIKELYPSYNVNNIVISEPSYAIANGAARCAYLKINGVDFPDSATCTYGYRFHSVEDDNYYVHNAIFKGAIIVDDKITIDVNEFYNAPRVDSDRVVFTVYESVFEKKDGDILFSANEDKLNANGLTVTVYVPEEYYKYNKAKQYSLRPRMTLTSDGILELEILHDGKVVASNHKKL